MINTLTRAAMLGALMTGAIFAGASPALSQAPTQAQRDAIKSACRSDYMAHCSSVPPGGEASLQCLQKNMSSLGPGCQSAVKAVEAPAAPKTEAAPTEKKTETAPAAAPTAAAPGAAAPAAKPAVAAPKAAEPKPAAATAAKQPTSAEVSAIRSACRSDYPKVCAGVPTGGAPALQCLEKNKAEAFAGLREGGCRRQRRRSGASRRRGSCCRSGRCARDRRAGGAHRHCFAAYAAARRTVRAALGLQRRCPHHLRRRGAGRRPDHAVSGDQCRPAFAGMPGRVVAVQGAMTAGNSAST